MANWISTSVDSEQLEELYAALMNALPVEVLELDDHIQAHLDSLDAFVEEDEAEELLEEYADRPDPSIAYAADSSCDNFHDGDREDKLQWLNGLLDAVVTFLNQG